MRGLIWGRMLLGWMGVVFMLSFLSAFGILKWGNFGNPYSDGRAVSC